MKKATKKLALRSETIRVMTSDNLQQAAGGSIVIIRNTNACPSINPISRNCPSIACTITSGGTSVINPSGG